MNNLHQFFKKYYLSFLIATLSVLFKQIYYMVKGLIFLPWPGRQIIPSILFQKEKLLGDFYTKSMEDSQYEIISIIFNKLNFFSTDTFLASYSSFSIVFYIVVIVFSSLLLTEFIKFLDLFKSINHADIEKHFLIFFTIILSLSILLPQNLNFIFLGIDIAGFNFPLITQLNPGGISFLLTLFLAIKLLKSVENKTVNITYKLLFIISIIIHPVIPLFLILLNFVILILSDSKSNFYRKLVIEFIINIIIFILTVFIIRFYYITNNSIDNVDLFDIYVVDRHMHHYLPSNYFNLKIFIGLLINTVTLSFFLIKSNNWKIKKLIKLTIVIITLIHLGQYFFVEYLKLKPFILLGISRMSTFYNFIFITLLGYVFFRYSKFNDFFKRIINYRHNRFLVVLIVILLLCFHFDSTKHLIKNNNSRILANNLSTLSLTSNSEILLDYDIQGEFQYLREIGNLNVFSDNYFPFSVSNINEWKKRKDLREKFIKNISDRKENSELIKIISQKNIILFITYSEINDFKLISNFKLSNKENCFVYKL